MTNEMKITRIDSDREVNKPIEKIEIEANGKRFLIEQYPTGDLCIHSHDGRIVVSPCVSNEVLLGAKDD